MSNNSWKQFGGVSQIDNFTTVNAGTIIADQFLSRTTKPIDQLYNGSLTVSQDIIAGNSVDSGKCVYVNKDLYVNRKVYFFGNSSELFINTQDYDTTNSNFNYTIRYDTLKDDNNTLFLNESADLLFHYLILLSAKNFKLSDIVTVLKTRQT